MSHPRRDPSSRQQPRQQSAGQPPGLPRWVLVAGIVLAVLVLVAVAVMLLSGGQHGPGRHTTGQPTIGLNR